LVNTDEEPVAADTQGPQGPEILDVLRMVDTPLDKIPDLARALKNMGDDPMITRNALLGNEAADRHLTNEAQKRRTVSF